MRTRRRLSWVLDRCVPLTIQTPTRCVRIRTLIGTIAAAGRSGIEEVYGVLYLDVGCDVCCSVALIHHFSPLITAIRHEP